MRREVTQVKKAHGHGDLTDVFLAGRGRDQQRPDRIEAQIAQVLDRAQASHRLKTVLQGPAADAQLLASSMRQAVVRLRTGQPGKLQPPVTDYYDMLPPQAQAMLADVLSASSIGTQADVERDLAAFLRRTRADELILTGQIFDPAARKHSFAIAMAAAQAITTPEPVL